MSQSTDATPAHPRPMDAGEIERIEREHTGSKFKVVTRCRKDGQRWSCDARRLLDDNATLRADAARREAENAVMAEALQYIGHFTRANLEAAKTLHYDMNACAQQALTAAPLASAHAAEDARTKERLLVLERVYDAAYRCEHVPASDEAAWALADHELGDAVAAASALLGEDQR